MENDDSGMRRMFREKDIVDPRYSGGHLHKGRLRTKFLESRNLISTKCEIKRDVCELLVINIILCHGDLTIHITINGRI